MARPPNTNHCLTEGAKAHLDDEFELGRLTGGQVSWPLAFQSFADMDAGLARLASTLRQASSGTSLPPAFGLRAAEFTWVVPTATPTSSSGREAKVPVCLSSKETW